MVDLDFKFKFSFFELRKVCRYPVCGMCSNPKSKNNGYLQCNIVVCPVLQDAQQLKVEAEKVISTNSGKE